MNTHKGSNYAGPGRFSTALLFAAAVVIVSAFSGCPKDTTPPGDVTAFTATAGDTKIMLSWTNPADSDFAGVLIQRKTGGYPSSPTDGTQAYKGMGTSFTDSGLTNGTPYFYTAFSYDTSTNYASGTQASAVPTVATALTTLLEEFGNVHTLLTGPPGNTVPVDQAGQLIAKLEAAEDAYRGGDTCGAASLLGEYETLAQTFRQLGATQGIIIVSGFERLYNEGRRLRYQMIADTSFKDLCPGQERIGLAADTAVDEARTDNTQVIASAAFGEPKFLTIETNGEVFTELSVPGADALTGDSGMPAVPMLRRLVAVPDGAEVSFTIFAHEAESVYLNLLPTQPAPVDQAIVNPGPPPAPSTFADRPFQKNDQAYQSDGPWPPDVVTMTEIGKLRDLRVFLIEAAAGQYMPKSNKLTLFKGLDVQVHFAGGSGYFLNQASVSPFESNLALYSNGVINRVSASKYVNPGAIIGRLIGEEFMILTPNALLDAANALATWKNTKGILTKVFIVGPGTDYTTTTTIANLIQGQFNSALVRPSYVLLLGDAQAIPTFYTTPNGDVGSPTIATDYPYSAFGLLPIFPNLALGRIPVENLTDANTVVNKIINYEKSPPGFGHQAFYGNATIASDFQCCRTGSVSLGTDQRTFVETSEFARDAMVNAGYSVQRIYGQTVDSSYSADSTPRRYYDGTLLPSDIGGSSSFAWNGSETDIVNAFNAGKFLFIHRDHGWPGGWGTPSFTWSDATALTNGSLLPVVFSVNCASGFFDEETAAGALGSSSGGQYFAERLLVNPNGGAVGLLGDTRNSPSWANSALLRGYIDAIWPNAIPSFGDSKSYHRLGDILNHGKIYLFSQGSTSGTIPWGDVGDEFRLWHCIGDPTLEIWTGFPYHLVLPTSVHSVLRDTTLLINYAAPGATITVTQQNPNGGTIPIARGVVGADGTVELPYFRVPDAGIPVQYAATLNDSVVTNPTNQ